ncbi:sedoheptulose 7-phosphate cyclase [Euzebya tangerina]|uniref:sedoheptulose 7-phosphate cyclase n=1 Tax=Euzebya tangerina TaxID=591198 RepID=UPI000E311836|nr:sedoheptulose 7-phosphate cyclase [Euzebya tangerina]
MTVSALISEYVENADLAALRSGTSDLAAVVTDPALEVLLHGVLGLDVYDEKVGRDLQSQGALTALPAVRQLRTSLNDSVVSVAGLIAEVAAAVDAGVAADWWRLAEGLRTRAEGSARLLDLLRTGPRGSAWADLADQLVQSDPHAVYPTSPYRRSDGHVLSSSDDTIIEAAMTQQTFTSLRIVEDVLDPDNRLLRDVWAPAGRVVAVVDSNVAGHLDGSLEGYFAAHDITVDQLVVRAMEVDKGLGTVERLLGHFKELGVSRREPVLVVGGGVLTDVAGLACALYHRNTPYVMLATSLVAGIDAGPSPRTCCDGFGYKNLVGAYHPPILTITDRTFFATLREGWLRHGVAEIIKMAVVEDADLFSQLEAVGPQLVTSRFGTLPGDDPVLAANSRQILAGALRSYVQAEYDNLYETHQARPHAYGHTWSPGFEIDAGLLHGHAVSIGMALGATAANRAGMIPESVLHRILRLQSGFGLSLWHDILEDRDLLWLAQERITQKRGGRLVAPVPTGDVGRCGYIDTLERTELEATVDHLRGLAASYPRAGRGIEPLCSDVGLEDPATVGHTTIGTATSR